MKPILQEKTNTHTHTHTLWRLEIGGFVEVVLIDLVLALGIPEFLRP